MCAYLPLFLFFSLFPFLSLVLFLTAYEHGIHGSFFSFPGLLLYQSQKSPHTWLYFLNLIISSIMIITIFPTTGFISAGRGFSFFCFLFRLCSIGYWYKKAIGISGVWLFSSFIFTYFLSYIAAFLHSSTLNTFFFFPPPNFLRPEKSLYK